LTNAHQTSAGAYRLPDAYAAADLSWAIERYQCARSELVGAGLINHDAASSVVMITRWFRINPPMNEKHLKGIRQILERLPSQAIWQEATAELDEVMEAIANDKAEKETRQTTGKTPVNRWASWKPRAASRPST
jgi:hypothetical protein